MTQLVNESFKVNYFIYIVDQTLSSLKNRFENFQKYEETFGFLYDLSKLKSTNNDSLKSYCSNLEDLRKHDQLFDINEKDLFSKLQILKEALPKETNRAIEVLNYLKEMGGWLIASQMHGLLIEFC